MIFAFISSILINVLAFAIALALITKEVYSSLFVGILVGALFYSNFNFEGTILHIFEGGMISVLTDSYNMGILIFLVILGTMVCLMNRAGGSAAFGRWAGKRIKSRVGAELSTIILGVLIFIDDYFNCLTVGSVMRPVTDKHNVSRAKLAYLIDATAAPVCIIAPISSWAAAVSGFVEGEDGITLFVHAIPYNFYALLTIFMMVAMVLMKVEFGTMGVHETNALKGDIYTTPARPYANAAEDEKSNPRGKVIDLLIPIVSFESPKQGKLLILHGSGDEDMSVAIIPSSQDTASALVKADNLVEGTDFEIQDYKSEEVSGVNVYSYTVHYLTDKSDYKYVVNKYFTDNTTEFYSVAGSVKDEKALAGIKTSVDSFTISGDSVLKAAATGKTSGTTAGTTADGTSGTAGTAAAGTDGTASGSSSDGSSSAGTDGSYSDTSSDGSSDYSSSDYTSDGSSDGSYDYDDGSSNGNYADGTPVGTDDPDYDTDQTRTIYRNSDGYPLVIYPNGDGTWCDDDGNTYDFANGEDVYDENGVDYYYHGEPAYVRYMPKNQ